MYTRCVQQARRAEFYEAGIPDTVEGRFDLILLHVYLVMRVLKGDFNDRQQLFDLMFGDMDRSLRELGVGDMSIRKKMRPMISAFYGRGQAYEASIAGDDAILSMTLARNLFGSIIPEPKTLFTLTVYVRQTVDQLSRQAESDLLNGLVQFPDPVLSRGG